MTRPFIRSSVTRVAALAAGLAMLVAALPPVQAGEPQSRVQVALNRAAETQPRYIPKAPDGVSEFAAIPQLKPIHFAFDRAEVRRSEAAIVDADAAWLRANPDYAILVTGHADPHELHLRGVTVALRLDAHDRLVTTLPTTSGSGGGGKVPVVTVDGKQIGTGKPGAVSARIYEQFVRMFIRP